MRNFLSDSSVFYYKRNYYICNKITVQIDIEIQAHARNRKASVNSSPNGCGKISD